MEAQIIEEVPLDEVETIEQEVTDVDIRDMEDEEYAGIAANDVQPESKMYRSFKCHICKVYFTRLHTLKSHISTNHPELDWNDLYRTTTFKCGEGTCKYIGKTRTDLLGHLYQEHDFVLHKVEGEFISTDDFTVFFEKLQKVHKVRFVKKRGKSLESATQYFVCSRDGYVKTGRAIKFGGDFVRKRNTSSHKIGTFCTAHVSVRSFPDGRITIEGYTTHYNHAIEGKRLALLDSERKFIKYHAQRGKSIRDIIELIHHTIGANVAEDDPLRFLNARTVRNVVNSVSVEVPNTAEQLFFQINGPEVQDGVQDTEGVSPDEVQVIEGVEHGEILEEELDYTQHIEITQVPMTQVATRGSAGQRQHVVTALVFHDYERKTPDATKTTVDPEFVAVFEEMKQHIFHMDHSIQTEDIVNLRAHFETLKSLMNRTESPSMVKVEEYR